MEGAKTLAWLPPAPLPSGTSAYVVELIKMLKVWALLEGECRSGGGASLGSPGAGAHLLGTEMCSNNPLSCKPASAQLTRLSVRVGCADSGISESIPPPAPPPNQDTFGQAQARLPRSSYLYLCRTVVRSVATAYVRLFSPEGSVKAFNMYAVHKLAEDLRELRATVAGLAVPDVDLEFAEASQLCAMLLAERVGGWVGCPPWRGKGGAPLLEEVGSPFLGGGGLKP